MKKGWKFVKLGEIAEIKGGKRVPKGKTLTSIPTAHKYIRVADFNDIGSVDMDDIQYITDDVYEQIKRYIITSDDVYVSIAGTIGKTGIIPKELDGANLTENACKLQLSADADKRFVYYFTLSTTFKSQISASTKVSAQPKLALTRLAEVQISIPSLPEQQRIVDYLDKTFVEIDAMKAKAAEEVANAKAMFEAVLREEMTPKEGWEEYNLVKELKLKSGDNLTAKKQKTGSIPVYGGNGITGYHNESNLSGPQILIGRVGALCGNIHYTEDEIWVTDNAFIVTNKREDWDIHFLVYELQYMNLNQYASQTAQPVISNKSMKDVLLYMPSLKIQQRIVAKLDTLRSHLTELEQKYNLIAANCDALKQAILRETFE